MTRSSDGGANYAFVTGNGRSGTNWLLELLDLSPQTFCRSEPSGIETSPLKALDDDRFVKRADQSALDSKWDDAVEWTARHMGERDRAITMPKDFIYPLSRRLGLYRMVRGPRFRWALSCVLSSLRGGEWPLPSYIFNFARMQQALPILKLVSSPGWSDYVICNRPDSRMFHIVRHPGGYLHSWATRYRSKTDEEKIHRENRVRLETIAREQPQWGERFGDILAMSTEESELWFWCYAAETIDRAGEGKPGYYRIIYEELTSAPIPIVKRCYEMCGLEWSESVEQAVLAASLAAPSIAAKWRKNLSPEQIALTTRILDQSTLGEHWPRK